MTDDLVERVARAICAADGNDWADTAEAGRVLYRHEARAAIAIVLEEAAQVAESYEPRCDTCPRGVAAAIRALIKEGSND